jgi:hypothetical protein
MCSPLVGRAIEVSGRIEHQSAKGVCTIIVAGTEKAIDYGLGPRATGIRQLEDHAIVVGTAIVGRAIKMITRGVGNQGAIGNVTVHTAGLRAEVVEHSISTGPGRSCEGQSHHKQHKRFHAHKFLPKFCQQRFENFDHQTSENEEALARGTA